MKTGTKAFVLMMAVLLLITAASLGTMAYMFYTEKVNNTFTAGSVRITLNEAPVGTNGRKIAGDRVKTNEYKLIPGHEYDKDPVVHFEADSEAAWLFVKVENGIADIEAAGNTIAAQIEANGWTALDGVAGVYYQRVGAAAADTDYAVFEGFAVSDTVDSRRLAQYAGAEITITAYAVQADGFDTAAAAWTTGLGN